MDYFTVDGLRHRFKWFRRLPIEQWRELRQWVYQRDGGKCQYCGKAVELHECHCHHVLPLSENGSNHPSNLKTLCAGCHKERHPHMKNMREKIREWIEDEKVPPDKGLVI